MAVPTNIKTLLARNAVEWARIEFKETWNAETTCAFANDIDNWDGGYLVIGVEEKDGKSVHLRGGPADLSGVQPEVSQPSYWGFSERNAPD